MAIGVLQMEEAASGKEKFWAARFGGLLLSQLLPVNVTGDAPSVVERGFGVVEIFAQAVKDEKLGPTGGFHFTVEGEITELGCLLALGQKLPRDFESG